MRPVLFLFSAVLALAHPNRALSSEIEQWHIFELTLQGPSGGNPFVDVQLSARFAHGDRVFEPEGFYDGDGVYKIRFMPDTPGEWTYVTQSNVAALHGEKGSFTCAKARSGNRGPVRVHNTFQFAHADGTPHFSVGTTCYAWVHQGDELEAQTLETLANAPFNKVRMCVFPKAYIYNDNEPQYYAYQGTPQRDWDFKRFNPAFWRHLENRVGQLRDMGIEADIIIFHPYDRWGFKEMGHENNLVYLRYLVARLAAYSNVWWSLANEYDFLQWPEENWDAYFQLIRQLDPYGHLRGIHNGRDWYDHRKEWVTHASMQTSYFAGAKAYRDTYQKPIVFDECRYEGDVPQEWGNLSGKQMLRYFWMGSLAGCYVGHGETYEHPQDLLWWAKGGVLRGQSPGRIQFMKEIFIALPLLEMTPDFSKYPDVFIMAKEAEYYLMYFANQRPVEIDLAGEGMYKLDGIDTWNMEVLALGSARAGTFAFTPPKADYAIRLSRYAPGERMRPETRAYADRSEGVAPLTVHFSTSWEQSLTWDFGDSANSSEKAPVHTYDRPGMYAVALKVTDTEGVSSLFTLPILVDRPSTDPVLRFGFARGEYPQVSLHGGEISKSSDGAYDLGSGKPFSWIEVGDGPIEDLQSAMSLTISGWLRASSMEQGAGGNRILFSLMHDRAGIDLVHHADGRLRLAINEWPDGIDNDSSIGRVQAGKWVFFAVTYDASRQKDNVSWYFGDENTPVTLDRKTSYNNGAVAENTAQLAIGNFNRTLQGAGLDRQFRGQIRALLIHASRLGGRGVLSLEQLRALQGI